MKPFASSQVLRLPPGAIALPVPIYVGAVLALSLIAGLPVWAQVVNDGATNTLSNVTNTITGNVVVGTNGSFTLLSLSDNALLTNSGLGAIGVNTTARSNEVRLISPTARWQMAGNLNIGSNGSFNRLIVSNGAFVRNNQGNLGLNAASSNNFALATGTGSFWSNANELYVGFNGGGNQLIVSNGAVVRNASGYVGLGGVGNLGVVSGSGSVWSNAGDVFVGVFGTGHRLVVSNAGAVRNNYGFVGVDASSSNNQVVVTGPGSLWSNSLDLYVGYSSTSNQVIVSNGAAVFSAGQGFFGYTPSAKVYGLLVTDPGSTLMFASNLYFGSNGSLGQLIISNSAVLASRVASIGTATSSVNHRAFVTGAGSVWSNALDFFVGYNGSSNLLVVSNGATVLDSVGEIGGFFGSNNLAVVTGSGSLWSNASDLIIGRLGPGNQLVVSNGARVQSPLATLGANSSSPSNTVLIAGAGSSLTVPTEFDVGGASTGNRLMISNGAAVLDTEAYLGFAMNFSNNEALVTGPGSTWTNHDLFVGNAGSGSRLVVTNGGIVAADGTVTVGAFLGSSGNRLTLDGGTLGVVNPAETATLEVRRGTNLLNNGLIDADQLLLTLPSGAFEFNGGTLITRGAFISNSAPFVVGASGSTPALWDMRAGPTNHFLSNQLLVGNLVAGNQITLTNGAQLTANAGATIGFKSVSNLAILSGVSSRWTLGPLNVGDMGSFNTLVVSNGAAVAATQTQLGASPGSIGNQAQVSGIGSTCDSSLDLYVGYLGPSNLLAVSQGGRISNRQGYLAVNLFSSNNVVQVTGSGSVWSNANELYVGYGGAGNRLVVSQGGALNDTSAFIGFDPFGSNNLALLSDPGSMWSNSLDILIGNSGANNQVVVSNGAALFGRVGLFGNGAGANLNSAMLTDTGTRWILSSNLYVGSNGSLNQLVISNGATVANRFSDLGSGTSSSNNLVIVTGNGSFWSNGSALYVGDSGRGNRLVITNGAVVSAVIGEIGHNSSSSSNEVLVAGPGSFFTIPNSLFIGSSGSGNRLTIANGGAGRNDSSYIGFGGTNNEVLVTDPGSSWTNLSTLRVGDIGPRNRLVISNAAQVYEFFSVVVGNAASSTNNRIIVEGGTLRAANFLGTGILDVRRGTNVLNGGLIDIDQLILTNSIGFFEFNGGVLSSKNTRVSNGTVFRIGNGVTSATMMMQSNGVHDFTGSPGIQVSSNATLTGNGTIVGPLTISSGAKLIPGSSIGRVALSNSPSLQGSIIMEVSRNGTTLTNDQVQVAPGLTYNGSLIVTNIGPDALSAGDRFKLFDATSFTGSFTSVSLPTLGSALNWTNKLAVDGTIEVIGIPVPQFQSISLSGTNVIITGTGGAANSSYAILTATNVHLPFTDWVSIATNQFDSSGVFSFTNAIEPQTPQRFFRLRVP